MLFGVEVLRFHNLLIFWIFFDIVTKILSGSKEMDCGYFGSDFVLVYHMFFGQEEGYP